MLTTNTTQLIKMPYDMDICQADYPLDWYQADFVPYAEEYLALPNRHYHTIIDWMTPYVTQAQQHFGDQLLLLAHYYMGGEIVKIIEHFGGEIGDSYQLALKVVEQPHKSIIVESAVHFMAETSSILAAPNQQVYITNPKAGCTMEMFAKDYMVEPAFLDLNERYGKENIVPICYMNTSGRVKAMTGAQGGAVCTSSNVKQIFQWALKQNKKILFIPDRHMGENVAAWVGIPPEKIAYWPAGAEAVNYHLCDQDATTLQRFDNAQLFLFSSHCAVHSYYQAEMVKYWQALSYHVIAHPECPKTVVEIADSAGSTAFIWKQVSNDMAGTKKYAIATENHLVQNLKQHCLQLGIDVVNVGEAKLSEKKAIGCGCATMSRNDPPHLVAVLDLLRQGKSLDANIVQPGDIVNEFTGKRIRLSNEAQQQLRKDAHTALENMIRITKDDNF